MRHPERRAKWAARALVVSVLVLVGAVGWGVWANIEQNEKLQGVERAAPCRTLGPDAPECRRQSRLIVKSCLTHKPCRKLVVRLTQGRNELPERERKDAPKPPDSPDREKGVTPQPSPPASQQPGPPQGGPPGDPSPPGEPKPPPEPPPGPLDPVLEPVCELDPLDVC